MGGRYGTREGENIGARLVCLVLQEFVCLLVYLSVRVVVVRLKSFGSCASTSLKVSRIPV